MGDRIPVLLLGNKIDNEKEREVPRGLGEQLAKVRGEHPVSLDLEEPQGGLGMCPELGWDPSWGSPWEGSKQAGWCPGIRGQSSCCGNPKQ